MTYCLKADAFASAFSNIADHVLLLVHLVAALAQPFEHRPAVRLSADLARDVHRRLIRVEAETQLIMLDREDVRALRRDYVQHPRKAAGSVKQGDGEFYAPVARDKALLDNALDEADVDIAAGEHAHHVLPRRVYLPGQHGSPPAPLSACSAP